MFGSVVKEAPALWESLVALGGIAAALGFGSGFGWTTGCGVGRATNNLFAAAVARTQRALENFRAARKPLPSPQQEDKMNNALGAMTQALETMAQAAQAAEPVQAQASSGRQVIIPA